MKITVLVENTARDPSLAAEHGLSLFAEWAGGDLIMDFGRGDALLPNAEALSMDLRRPTLGVLSHGHFDHGGGIAPFRTKNPACPIYVQKDAFGPWWARRMDGRMEYIGLAETLREDENIRPVQGVTELSGGALLFDGITGRELYAPANATLMEKKTAGFVQDDFRHEQALILPSGSGYVLLGGCAHNGILNVMTRATELWGKAPDAVLSGFHLADPSSHQGYDGELTAAIGKRLLRYPTRYFTCHCTGLAAYEVLKHTMGDALDYAAAGCVFEL